MRRYRHVTVTAVALTVIFVVAACVPAGRHFAPEKWPSVREEHGTIEVTATPLPAEAPPQRVRAQLPEPAAESPPRPGAPSTQDLSACGKLPNISRSWYYVAAGAGRVPTVPTDVAAIVARSGALWRVPTTEKVVYLTFDQGYEAGFTARILDTLRAKGVHATFFLTGSYVRDEPDLVRRMAAEGHLAGNHTRTHPSLPTLAGDVAAFTEEYRSVERAYREVTGRTLARYGRPPRGEYSERTLCMVGTLGYTSVMWSFAHRDWLLDDQPPVDVAYKRIVDGAHPGAIMLLHSVSESNTLALPRVIDELRRRGYRFGTLDEIR
ncbi:MAG: polysaccharide deacetylase family protein [Coriobacteriia bacterium]|jgi:peptidoglycan-N-acetylmuramic acid deacetylase|nr:polysaccharide deacetylase family protein [Coriobacteriia bacterium]